MVGTDYLCQSIYRGFLEIVLLFVMRHVLHLQHCIYCATSQGRELKCCVCK